jgi:hypothetical protein
MMEAYAWDLPSNIPTDEPILTTIAQITPDGDAKADWPYSVGALDFNLYDCQRGPTVQTIIPASVPAGANIGQVFTEDNKFSALRFTLPFLQRRWGIGDRKTRGTTFQHRSI